MATQKQIEANRRNAASSTGPRTGAGKQRSRCNATTHGLTAATTIYRPVRHEDPEDFAAVRDRLFSGWNPVGGAEELAVEMMAAAYKRAQRADAIDAAYYSGAMDAIQHQHGQTPAPSQESDDLGCGIALGKDEHKLTWQNLDRYRRSAWLDYNRTVEQLRRLQKDRLELPLRQYQAWTAGQQFEKALAATADPDPKLGSFCKNTLERQPLPLKPPCNPEDIATVSG